MKIGLILNNSLDGIPFRITISYIRSENKVEKGTRNESVLG